MKFIAGVNITQTLITFLRHLSHEVTDIKKQDPKITDIEIVRIAKKEDLIILTHDKDFLVLVKYPKYQVGTIAIRLQIQNAQYFCERLKELLDKYSKEVLGNSLTVLKEEGVEVHPYSMSR